MNFFECCTITSRRVLLAAENETSSKRLNSYLVNQKYLVKAASCGEEVVSYLTAGIFDLCIIDFGLAGTPFHSIVDYLASILCFTPIVLMISNSKCTQTHDIAAVAPIYMLFKPFTLTEFGSVVSSVVGRTGITVTTRPQRKCTP